MTIDLAAIPSPGELLRKHGLSPRKSWGQNFLHDRNVHAAIVRAADARPGRRVVEIGAGLGDLAGKVWRIGLMGYASNPTNVRLCLAALENSLMGQGLSLEGGAAVAAANAAYRNG